MSCLIYGGIATGSMPGLVFAEFLLVFMPCDKRSSRILNDQIKSYIFVQFIFTIY